MYQLIQVKQFCDFETPQIERVLDTAESRVELEQVVRSRGLSLDNFDGWAEFLQVSRWFPSSKTCGSCGYVNDGLTLADREWVCSRCGVKHDRDMNAAKNILRQGLNQENRTVGTTEIADCLGVRPALGGLLIGSEAPPSLAAG